jgi:hypothetical protein
MNVLKYTDWGLACHSRSHEAGDRGECSGVHREGFEGWGSEGGKVLVKPGDSVRAGGHLGAVAQNVEVVNVAGRRGDVPMWRGR